MLIDIFAPLAAFICFYCWKIAIALTKNHHEEACYLEALPLKLTLIVPVLQYQSGLNVSLFLARSVFWDLYCAAPERRDTCEHSSEAKAFHDYVS